MSVYERWHLYLHLPVQDSVIILGISLNVYYWINKLLHLWTVYGIITIRMQMKWQAFHWHSISCDLAKNIRVEGILAPLTIVQPNSPLKGATKVTLWNVTRQSYGTGNHCWPIWIIQKSALGKLFASLGFAWRWTAEKRHLPTRSTPTEYPLEEPGRKRDCTIWSVCPFLPTFFDHWSSVVKSGA